MRVRGEFFRVVFKESFGCVLKVLGEWLEEQETIIAIRYHNRNREGGFYRGAGLFATDISLPIDLKNPNVWEIAYHEFQEATQTAGETYHWQREGHFRFNFQPDWPKTLGSAMVRFEDTAEYLDPNAPRMYHLDFIAREKAEGMELILRYSENFFKRETADSLLKRWKERL